MAKKKKAAAKETKAEVATNQTELLAAVVKSVGSEALVAEKLKCSQQSVSAWLHGTNSPREAMQRRMAKLWDIPMPWPKPGAQA